MPRLSIVIPAMGETARLEASLVSVLENCPADTEVIVVLREEYPDPYGLADEEVRFVPAPHRAGLAACVNEGLSVCQSPIVHLLACGCEATPGWAEEALVHFADERVAAVSPLVVEANVAPLRVITAGVDCDTAGRGVLAGCGLSFQAMSTTAGFILGPTSLAAFYRTAALEYLGTALEPSLGDVLCDLDLALRLERIGYLALSAPTSHVKCEASLVEDESPGYAQAVHAERLYRRHAGPDGAWPLGFPHAATIFGEMLRGLPRLHGLTQIAGRFRAALEGAKHRRLQQELALLEVAVEADGLTTHDEPEHLRIDATHESQQSRAVGDKSRARTRA